ncbi:NADPH-dependent FMN reductase [Calidifontibacter terrae]
MKKLGIIVGSTRPTRIAPHVADWVSSLASQEWEIEVLDLAQENLPFLDEPQPPMQGNYVGEHTVAWGEKIAGVDAIVIPTPEYNASFPATIKNAIDTLYAEWNAKPVTLVGYGWGGATNATEGLSKVLDHVKANVVAQVNLVFNTDLTPAGEVTATEATTDALALALTEMAAVQSADVAV